MSPNPLQHGLEWEYQWFAVVPRWSIEPDMAVAKAIAIRHLPVITSSYVDSFFSAGAFNKLFLLHPLDDARGTVESFIMRVSLPVDPYFKMASEVATLQFVQKHTTIPVPQVIAFDASVDNEPGFRMDLDVQNSGSLFAIVMGFSSSHVGGEGTDNKNASWICEATKKLQVPSQW